MRIAQILTLKVLIIYVQNIFQNGKKNQGKNMHDNLSSCADIAGNQLKTLISGNLYKITDRP